MEYAFLYAQSTISLPFDFRNANICVSRYIYLHILLHTCYAQENTNKATICDIVAMLIVGNTAWNMGLCILGSYNYI